MDTDREECTPTQSIASFPIFVSYAHGTNEELDRCIQSDLEKRGHDASLDKNDIKFVDEWRRSTTADILQSYRVLSFLSKHSTCGPGVCRNEDAIAIVVTSGNIQAILVESEQEVPPPVNIGHIQWIDMHSANYHLANPLRSVINGGREKK